MTRFELSIDTAAARIDTLVETPADEPRGLALIAHPHPLHGGTRDNKVAHILARAALARSLVAVRPNFRGVGGSRGEHDHGIGETDDMLAVAAHVGARFGALPWTLLGFSFGSYVQHRVARRLAARQLIMVGPAVTLYVYGPPAIPTVIIHGEQDELIPLAAVRDHAGRYHIPLDVVAGASHFFHGKLIELRELVTARLAA